MLRTLLAAILALTVSAAGAQIVNRPVAAGAISNPGTSLPSTCAVGYVYFKSNSTAGQNLHLCTAANTWTQMIGGNLASSTLTIGGGTLTSNYVGGIIGTGSTVTGTIQALFEVLQDRTTYRGLAFGYDSAAQAGVILADTSAAASKISLYGYTGGAWAEMASFTTSLATAKAPMLISTGTTANQLRTAQTTVPTVTTNGGTSPSCVGTDTFMICTIGTTPPAAATFTVTFNGTWAAAPSCIALRGTAGATPLVQNTVTATTTVQVNLSANLVASEKYHIHCGGIS